MNPAVRCNQALSVPLEERWYHVRAKEDVGTQEPPPKDHPQYERIVALQEKARADKLAKAKDVTYLMWGPQVAFLLQNEPYEVLGAHP